MRINLKAFTVAAMTTVMLAGCTQMPPPDAQYCRDLDQLRQSIDGTDVTRPQVKSEALDDVVEMGQQERCPGYVQHGQAVDD